MPKPAIRAMISANDREGLRKALEENPALANEGLPYDKNNQAKAPPLHRLCDDVFNNLLTEEDAIELAKIFLEYGADIDGGEKAEKKDTPLLAASSLHADKLAIYYIEQGADIHHAGCHGGTALHWAAWTGRDVVVKRLLQEKPAINRKCIDFTSTALFWAIHGYKSGEGKNRHHQVACARLLLEAGADKTIPNIDGNMPVEILGEEDVELKALLGN